MPSQRRITADRTETTLVTNEDPTPGVEGHVPPSGDTTDAEYKKHLLEAAHQASQDYDAWILKLGTAGITLVTGVAALTDAKSWILLIWAGVLFAGSLLAGLISIRLSADGLHRQASGTPYEEVTQYKTTKYLNWVAAVLLTTAYILLIAHLGDASIRDSQR